MSSLGGGPKKPTRSKTSEEGAHRPLSPPRPPRVPKEEEVDPVPLQEPSTPSEQVSEREDDMVSGESPLIMDDAAILLAKKDLLLALLSRDERALPARIDHLKQVSGQSLNYRDDETKETLLHKCIVQTLPPSLMLILLEHGARVDARDAHKASPLHYAAAQGQRELVEFLLTHNANPMLKDKYNQTALHKAACGGHAPVIDILLDKSVLINHQDTLGLTALHVAARSEQPAAVECLVRRGADLLCLTKEALRPVDCIPTLPQSKPRAKPVYSPSGKKIYKFLKRKGGCKKSSASTSVLVMGDGTRTHCVPSHRARTSITHELTSYATRDMPARATHTQSLTEFTDQDEVSVESSDSFDLTDLSTDREGDVTPELSPLSDQPRVDKRGFLIKENDPSAGTSSPSRKKVKKNAVKEEKRALKWISLFSSWNENMSKNYDKILKLCDAGIPDSVRGEAWKHLSGIAVEGRDNELYHTLLKQDKWEHATKLQIEKDIGRTMPGHILFQEKGQGRTMLTNVLLAYSAYNPEVGYCQGMGFPTAMFLMYMTEEDAFWLLDALCDNYGLGGLYKPGMLRIRQCMRTIGQLMQQSCPKVLYKMEEVGIDYNVFMPQFFLTGFLYCFPFDMVVRLWDCFWLRRFDFLYAVTLGLFKVTQSVIQGFDIDTLMDFLRFREGSRPLDFDIDQLLSASIHVFEKLKPTVLRAWEAEAMDELVSKRQVLTDGPAELSSTQSHQGTFKRQRSPRNMMRRGISSFTHHSSSAGEVRRVDNNSTKIVRKTRKTRKKNAQRTTHDPPVVED